ncbi:MAG: hypothetical protein AAF668_01055 [Pseudomonadota bacterium]
MQSVSLLLVVFCFGTVAIWYMLNENAAADGTIGVLALGHRADAPGAQQGNAGAPARYKARVRTADSANLMAANVATKASMQGVNDASLLSTSPTFSVTRETNSGLADGRSAKYALRDQIDSEGPLAGKAKRSAYADRPTESPRYRKLPGRGVQSKYLSRSEARR